MDKDRFLPFGIWNLSFGIAKSQCDRALQNMMIHLAPGKWSTAALMRVIVPIALELVLFQDAWGILLFPPFTMMVLALNLGLFFVLVRPRAWETRIMGMLLGGIGAVFLITADYLVAVWMQSRPPGLLGSGLQSVLMSCLDSLGDPAGDLASVLHLVVRHMTVIEAILLDLLGLAVIWAGGRLEHRCRARWGQRRISPSSAGDPGPGSGAGR